MLIQVNTFMVLVESLLAMVSCSMTTITVQNLQNNAVNVIAVGGNFSSSAVAGNYSFRKCLMNAGETIASGRSCNIIIQDSPTSTNVYCFSTTHTAIARVNKNDGGFDSCNDCNTYTAYHTFPTNWCKALIGII